MISNDQRRKKTKAFSISESGGYPEEEYQPINIDKIPWLSTDTIIIAKLLAKISKDLDELLREVKKRK